MNPLRTRGSVWIFLIIGLILLLPVGYVVYAGINHLIEARTIADKAWTIGGMIGLLAFPAAFIIPSLAIIIKGRSMRNRGRVYERCREPESEPQPEKPQRDLLIFKVGIGISLVLITIGTVMILSNREKKAKGIKVEGTIIDRLSDGNNFTVEFSIDGKLETCKLHGYGPLFRKKMKLYVSKDTYVPYGEEEGRHYILFCQNENLLWILLLFGCAAFIIFIVSVLTFSDDVETKTYNGIDESAISYAAGRDNN